MYLKNSILALKRPISTREVWVKGGFEMDAIKVVQTLKAVGKATVETREQADFVRIKAERVLGAVVVMPVGGHFELRSTRSA